MLLLEMLVWESFLYFFVIFFVFARSRAENKTLEVFEMSCTHGCEGSVVGFFDA